MNFSNASNDYLVFVVEFYSIYSSSLQILVTKYS